MRPTRIFPVTLGAVPGLEGFLLPLRSSRNDKSFSVPSLPEGVRLFAMIGGGTTLCKTTVNQVPNIFAVL